MAAAEVEEHSRPHTAVVVTLLHCKLSFHSFFLTKEILIVKLLD